MDFRIICTCDGSVLMDVKNASLSAWQRAITENGMTDLTCRVCGCAYNPSDASTHVGQADVSRPSISGASPATGPRIGGTSVTLTVHALDVGSPIVKIAGIVVSASAITDTSAQIVTPACPRARLRTVGRFTGILAIGDTVTGTTSAHSGVICAFEPDAVVVSSPTGSFSAGEYIQKDDSNKVRLANVDHWDGAVDISVENENGKRVTGSTLVRGFSYMA